MLGTAPGERGEPGHRRLLRPTPPMDGAQVTSLRQDARGEGRRRHRERAPQFQGSTPWSALDPCTSDEAQAPVVHHPGPTRARAAATGREGSCDVHAASVLVLGWV
ncbi:hypothetical protein NDU88_000800 [Pleurodeles waltl]|uniref:Uncharacterized protein n=1 Tax=Pleurodeles waltl TaxID=8319 RepID=A0AAV7TG17_PLEWA|nr:hypothetical protein NDU88_000800 [Pleurodeles waltl]